MRKKLAFAAVLALLLVCCLVAFVNSSYARQWMAGYLQRMAKDRLGVELRIGALDFTWSPLTVRLDDIEINGAFFHADHIAMTLPYSSLFGDEFVIHTLVVGPATCNLDLLPRFPQSAGGSTFKFRIEKATLQQGVLLVSGRKLSISSAEAKIGSDESILQTLSADLDGIRMTVSGSLLPTTRIDYEIQGDAEKIYAIVSQSPAYNLTGPVQSKGTVEGAGNKFDINGTAQAPALTVNGSAPFPVTLTYRVQQDAGRKYHVSGEWSALPLGLVQASLEGLNSRGNLTYAGTEDFWNGEGSVQTAVSGRTRGIAVSANVQGRLAGKQFLIDSGVLRAGSAQAEVSGSLNADSLLIKTRATIPDPASLSGFYADLRRVPGAYTFDGTVSGSYKNPMISGTLNGKDILVSGGFQPASGKVDLRFSGRLRAEDLRGLAPEGLNGTLEASGTVSGTASRPIIQAEAAATNVVFRGTDLGNIQIHAQSDMEGLNATLTGTSVEATAKYNFGSKIFEVDGQVESGSLDILHAAVPQTIPEHPGVLTGRFHASGKSDHWKAASAELEVQSATLKWRKPDIIISQGSTLKIQEGVLHADLQAENPNGALALEGTVDLFKKRTLDLHVSGKTSAALLNDFVNGIQAAGTISLDATVSGTVATPDVTGFLRTADLEITAPQQKLTLKQGSVEAKFSKDHADFTLGGLLNGGVLDGGGTVQFREESADLHATLKSFPLEGFVPYGGVSGAVDLTLTAAGAGRRLQGWNVNASLSSTDLQLNGTRFTADGPLVSELKEGRIHVGPWHGKAGEQFDVSLGGIYDISNETVDGELKASTDLGLLTRLPKGVSVGGNLEAVVQARGTLKTPDLSGSISLQNGMLHMPDSPWHLEEIQLSAPIVQHGLKIETLTARSGGGTITATGGIELVDRLLRADLSVQGKNVGLQYPPGLRSRVNFDLKLASSKTRSLLSGNVDILQSSYSDTLDFSNRLVRTLLSKREELAPHILLESRVQMDLKVRTVGDFQLNNNMGRIRAGADLQIAGNLYQPKYGGSIRVIPGSVIYFLGQTFEVEKAQIRLTGTTQFMPYFDVVLSTLIEDTGRNTLYEIQLPFGGPWNDIRFVNPRALPSLSEDEIYSLLLTGRADSETESIAGSVFQRELAAFVRGQLFFGAERKLAGFLGLTRIQIRTDALSTEDDPATKLILNKDFTGGFSFLYSFPLDRPNDQTFIGSYRYRRNLLFRAIAQDDGTYTFSGRHTLFLGPGADPNKIHIAQENAQTDVIVSDFKIINQSPLPENSIRKRIGLEAGSKYDYWEFQDHLDKLKQDLQKEGYLFPAVNLEEKESEAGNENTVDLTVTVAAGDPSRMVFTGHTPGSKQMASYLAWWRDGISEQLVLDQIQNDILHELWAGGYQRASLQVSSQTEGGVRVHNFFITPGPFFRLVLPEFRNAGGFGTEKLLKALLALYGSQAEMSVDLLHDFPEFQKYVEAAYFKEGYLGTKVTTGSIYTDEKAASITRTVDVEEGGITRIAAVSSSVDFPPDLARKLEIKPGSPVNVEAFATDETTVLDYYERKGYRAVTVTPKVTGTDKNTGLTLYYNIELGTAARVAAIRIVGNHFTSLELIQKQLGLKEGDAVSRAATVRAQNRLYNLGVFQSADVRMEETADPDLYDVVVDLQENRRYQVQYGLRYNTDSQVGGELGFSNLNMFGIGHTATLYGRYDTQNPLYRFDYIFPAYAGFFRRSFITAFYEGDDTTLGDYLDNRLTDDTLSDVPVTTTDTKLEFQQERRILKSLRILYGIELARSSIAFTESTIKFFALNEDFTSTATALETSLVLDTRDDALNAKKGNFVSVSAKWAPGLLGDSVSFSRIYSQYYTYKRLGPVIWASAVRAGFMDAGLNTFTLDEKFLAGGGSSVRGFGLDSIAPQDNVFTKLFGGNSVFILSEEVRVPIAGKLGGVLFYDGGNVYALASDFNPLDLRNSLGFGVRLDFSALVLRFDLGFNLKPLPDEPHAVFHFGIGQAF